MVFYKDFICHGTPSYTPCSCLTLKVLFLGSLLLHKQTIKICKYVSGLSGYESMAACFWEMYQEFFANAYEDTPNETGNV